MLSTRAFLVVCPLVLAAASLVQQSSAPAPGDAEEARVALCRSHYETVRAELEAADVSALSPEQRERRARLVEALGSYSARGLFGRNLELPGARVPQFVDRDERLCAVAELLHATGEESLIDEVRFLDNDAWICDLAGNPVFTEWLARNGLTLEEAARIQIPGTSAPSDSGSGGSGGSSGGSGGSAPSSGGGGSSGGSSGGSGSAPTTGGAPAPSSPGSAGPATGGATASTRASGPTTDADNSWWLWWEYNKLAYLKPNRLAASLSLRTGGDAEKAALDQIATLRASHTPWLVDALEEGDAMLRGTLAVTLGRTGGDKAVDALAALLEDPSVDVRHRALLALGATGAPRAAELLLEVAKGGAKSGKSGARISRLAAPLAIVALGLGRRAGFAPEVDAEVARLADKAPKGERELFTTAAMIYQTLAPCEALRALAMDVATDKDESVVARCRAIETLRGVSDPKLLSKLQDLLSGSKLELRRSAALALGGAATTLALPALQTAYELEAEPLTRGFLLIAIGEQGGAPARAFLLKQLEKGDRGLRPWCALALGIAARDAEDTGVRAALRAATAKEKNEDALGAYWIASGLARDAEATESAKTALARAKNPRMRMYAATSLALIGSDAARTALLASLATEGSDMVRVTIGQSLGELGRSEDAAAILGMMDGIRDPSLQALTAVAVSFHGSSEALRGLTELARSGQGASVKRAAAIDGLGMLLGRTAPLAFGEVSRGSNFTVSPDWVLELYQVTL